MIDYKQLIESGVHFGHQKTRWCPKMKKYIWGHRKGVHLIDISKTAQNLEKAAKFLEDIAGQGKTILLVGTKAAAQPIVEKIGVNLNLPYISYRWVGGLLTNYPQVKKSVTKFLHYQDVLERSDEFPYTKKELSILKKSVDRLKKSVGGIVKLSWPVGAIVVVDVKREATVIKEALQSGVPVVALVDTNSDPSGIDYVIPANDDSPKSIKLLLDYLASAIEKGQEVAKKNKALEKEAKQAKAPKVEEIALEEVIAIDEDFEEEGDEKTSKASKLKAPKKTEAKKESSVKAKSAKARK